MDETTSKEVLAFFGSPVGLAPVLAIVVQQIKGLFPRLDDGTQQATALVILLSWAIGAVIMTLAYFGGLTPDSTPLGLAIAMGVIAGLISNGIYATIKNTPRTSTTTVIARPSSRPARSEDEAPTIGARG